MRQPVSFLPRKISLYSRLSESSLPPTGVPQTAQRYSYLFPVGKTRSRWRRTGRAVRHFGQKSSDASSASYWRFSFMAHQFEDQVANRQEAPCLRSISGSATID